MEPGVNWNCESGFSRESVSGYTSQVRVLTLASSRLKPVLRKALRVSSETGGDAEL
jgi:hypothetical protein